MHYFIVIILCFFTLIICQFDFMSQFYVVSLSMSVHLNFLDAFLQSLIFIMKTEVPYFFYSFFGYFPFLFNENIMLLIYSIFWSEFQIFANLFTIFLTFYYSRLVYWATLFSIIKMIYNFFIFIDDR